MADTLGETCNWNRVISSPMARCVDFAREWAQRHELALEVDDRLREMDFGAWEGKTAEQLLRTDGEQLTRFWRNPDRHTPTGGESLATVQARVLLAWRTLTKRCAGERVLMISHGGPIRVILAHVLGMPSRHLLRLELPHAAISRVRVHAGVEGISLQSLVFHAGQL